MPKSDWSRLAEYVVTRRKELGYPRQVDLIHVSALGTRTLSSIEAGERTQYNRTTLAALEQALEWAPGSINDVLNGDEPTPANPDATETTPKERSSDSGLPSPPTDYPPGLSEREKALWRSWSELSREGRMRGIEFLRFQEQQEGKGA